MQLDKARQQPAAFPIQRLRQPALAFAKARMRPSWTSSEPWTTSSSRTSCTLLIIMLSFHRVQSVGDLTAYPFVMENPHDGSAARFGIVDQVDHGSTVFVIQ
ncbi:Uncharacterised protein [Klebsiella pneumoniae]|uniref:Uncharacterized protein n=1 Tax=Klebsiella pneumoniae TaxID=573 RepID=A0A377TIN7_KLEPN|nr:Uncharacterised protein [Klebsiella pneumoniae]